jgi:carboxyl-terminal processing protease
VKGLVLDVRGNPGGLLASALGVAAGFLPKSAVVLSLRGRVSAQDTVLRADTPFEPS